MKLIDADELSTVTDIREDGAEFTYIPYSEIEEAQTAYDIDKIVEQLEVLRDKAVKHPVTDTSIYATGMMGKAIQIVKVGGKEC